VRGIALGVPCKAIAKLRKLKDAVDGLKASLKMERRMVSQARRVTTWASCLFLLTAAACTSERNSAKTSEKNLVASATLTKSVVGGGSQVGCRPEDLSGFTSLENSSPDVFDLEHEELPRGLFLATKAEMRIEKKPDVLAGPSRIVVHETMGGNAEIVCAEGLDRLGVDFEMAISGLVKFQTNERPEGSGFTSRQYFFFQDKDGYGLVLSNPKQLTHQLPLDLRKTLRSSPSSPQLIRLNDRTFILKYSREVEGVHADLLVYLDLAI
jgi:hypothetical protein